MSRSIARSPRARQTYRFFEAAMDFELQSRRRLENDLRKALAEERIRSLLPADQRRQDQGDPKFRGPGALASSRARHHFPGGIHPARRRNRIDRPVGRMGAQNGVQGSDPLAFTTCACQSICPPANSERAISLRTVREALADQRPAGRGGWNSKSPNSSCSTAAATISPSCMRFAAGRAHRDG